MKYSLKILAIVRNDIVMESYLSFSQFVIEVIDLKFLCLHKKLKTFQLYG